MWRAPLCCPLALATLLVMLCAPRPADATVILRLDLHQLTGQADAIFIGTVSRVASRWTDDGRRIVTDTTLRVDDGVKGVSRGQEVIVRQPGGLIGGVGMHVSGTAPFRPGERVVLFTQMREGRRYLIGMAQGVYRIGRDAKGRAVVLPEGHAGISLARRGPAGIELESAPGAAAAMPGPEAPLLESFVRRVREIARECARSPQRCTGQ